MILALLFVSCATDFVVVGLLGDAETRLFRSGTHGLNDELGGTEEGKSVCCVMLSVRVLVMSCVVGLSCIR